ncbi:c-type cytochrome [Terrihabitans sp. B22-R8]|uniref:c-type cytochrome n=1 Tax=Terrihabitans sp. B22-R8 TaxID=3425128 RepID=UPI00403CAFFF
MMRARPFSLALIAITLAGGTAFWALTTPARIDVSAVLDGPGDVANGARIFYAGGCGSCHAIPGGQDPLALGGGLRLKSPFGTFTAPNISPDPEHGIGGWTQEQFVTALVAGTSPQGQHYYPAFPYVSYRNITPADARDLFAYMQTLPAASDTSPGHDFPLNLALVRRGVGLWKRLYLGDEKVPADPARGEAWNRGAYLVEALGHCGECHTPRTVAGGLIEDRRFGGGIGGPNITSGRGGIGDWTEDDIAFLLEDGSTPEGDVVGGEMARVVRNTARLSEEDRRAIAVYVKSLPPVDRQ